MPTYRLKSGTLKYEGKKYHPGDTFEAQEFEMRFFLDTLERLDEPEEPEKDAPYFGLRLRHKGAGKYDVINEATGEPINDSLLDKEEAQALIEKEMEAGTDAELEGTENVAGGDGLHPGWGAEPGPDEPGPDQEP
jgi:hypothetical protein